MAGKSGLVAAAAGVGLMVLGTPALANAQLLRPAPRVVERQASSSATSPGRLEGIVKDEKGAPVAGAMVSALGAANVFAVTDLDGRFLATSGDYERYFELSGRRYCHVLNPRSGYPVAHWQSVSVVAPVCVAAGSYSTIAMLLESRGRKFLDREGLPYLLVSPNGSVSGPLAA